MTRGNQDYNTVPVELRERDQRVIWRPQERNGKATKVPYQPRQPRSRARVDDSSTWGSFADAVRAAVEAGAGGIGYVFTAGDPFAGVDLDRCFDSNGKLYPAAAALVALFGSYTERSPSNGGSVASFARFRE